MSRKTKPSSEPLLFGSAGGKQIEVTFEDIADQLALTHVDRALARISFHGLPALLEFLGDDTDLLAALTAIEPKLKLCELDEACSKLEDLAINLLAATRGCRHTASEFAEMHGASALASKALGEEAIEMMDKLTELEVLDEDEASNNAKLLRSSMTSRHRA